MNSGYPLCELGFRAVSPGCYAKVTRTFVNPQYFANPKLKTTTKPPKKDSIESRSLISRYLQFEIVLLNITRAPLFL